MAFIKTRNDFVLRAQREAHRRGDTGTGTQRDLHEMTVDVLNQWHETMARSSWSGVGKAIREVSVVTAGPTLDLPTEHMFLKGWTRDDLPLNGSSPVRVLPMNAIAFTWDVAGCEPNESQGAYYIEGPGQEFDEGLQALATYPQRIRAFPDFAAGTTVKLLYISQPPNFGNPQDETDDETPVDVIVPSNYAAISSLVRLLYTGRGDTDEYRRAIQAAADAAAESTRSQDSQDRHRPIDPSAYLRRGGTSGYELW